MENYRWLVSGFEIGGKEKFEDEVSFGEELSEEQVIKKVFERYLNSHKIVHPLKN